MSLPKSLEPVDTYIIFRGKGDFADMIEVWTSGWEMAPDRLWPSVVTRGLGRAFLAVTRGSGMMGGRSATRP